MKPIVSSLLAKSKIVIKKRGFTKQCAVIDYLQQKIIKEIFFFLNTVDA